MRILVTGSAGLVGTELTAALAARGAEVVPFDLRDPGRPADLCDPAALAAAVAGCDGVMHLAAISRVAWGEADPALTHRVNVEGTARLIAAIEAEAESRAVPPWLLFVSSREIYGDPAVAPGTPLAETLPAAPVNAYGRSKAEGEVLVAAARARGLVTAIVRLSNVYGTERDHPDRAVPALMWRALAGEPLAITGADNYFDFVHVDDCVAGLLAAMDRLAAGQRDLATVHLATGVATSLGALARAALAETGSTSTLTVLPPRAFDVSGFCGDPARAQAVLGWQARIPLAEGLARLKALLIRRGRPLDPVTMPVPETGSASDAASGSGSGPDPRRVA